MNKCRKCESVLELKTAKDRETQKYSNYWWCDRCERKENRPLVPITFDLPDQHLPIRMIPNNDETDIIVEEFNRKIVVEWRPL